MLVAEMCAGWKKTVINRNKHIEKNLCITLVIYEESLLSLFSWTPCPAFLNTCVNIKVKVILIQAWTGQVRLSAISTGSLSRQKIFLVLISVSG